MKMIIVAALRSFFLMKLAVDPFVPSRNIGQLSSLKQETTTDVRYVAVLLQY